MPLLESVFIIGIATASLVSFFFIPYKRKKSPSQNYKIFLTRPVNPQKTGDVLQVNSNLEMEGIFLSEERFKTEEDTEKNLSKWVDLTLHCEAFRKTIRESGATRLFIYNATEQSAYMEICVDAKAERYNIY